MSVALSENVNSLLYPDNLAGLQHGANLVPWLGVALETIHKLLIIKHIRIDGSTNVIDGGHGPIMSKFNQYVHNGWTYWHIFGLSSFPPSRALVQ